MTGSISHTGKKGRGRPKVGSVGIHVAMPPEQLQPLDAWIEAQPEPKPSRPEAIRHALADWLTGQGYARHREDPEGAN